MIGFKGGLGTSTDPNFRRVGRRSIYGEYFALILLIFAFGGVCDGFSVPDLDMGENENLLDNPQEIEDLVAYVFNKTRGLRNEEELTLITFLQRAVRSYGQKRVARSIYELAQKDLYDLIWMLAGELDTYLIFDLYNVYSAAQSDPNVLSVYQRFRAGNVNRTIVPEVFALDRKYDQYNWWQRVRGRMLNSVDRYIAGKLDLNNGKTPPPIEYDHDGKVIIAGVRIPDSSTVGSVKRGSGGSVGGSSTVGSLHHEVDGDSDEDILDILNSNFERDND